MTTTADQLIKHARRFGTEGVLEAARDIGASFQSLVELQRTLDDIDEAKAPRWAKKTRLSVETRVRRKLGLEEDTNGK